MQEHLATTKELAPPDCARMSPSPKSSRSSASLGWKDLLVEDFCGVSEERVPSSPNYHTIYQLKSCSLRCQRRLEHGAMVPLIKKLDTISIVPAGPVPFLEALEPASFICSSLDIGFVEAVAAEMDTPPRLIPEFLSGVRNASLEAILNLLDVELQAGGPSGPLYVESLGHALAVRFVLTASSRNVVAAATALALPQHIARRIQDRIEAELTSPLTLTSLAKESGYSRAHFLRMFHTTVGKTPYQYLLSRRVRRAQRLLEQDPAMPLAQIAAATGFSSQAHMTDVFRKQQKKTPGQYRRRS